MNNVEVIEIGSSPQYDSEIDDDDNEDDEDDSAVASSDRLVTGLASFKRQLLNCLDDVDHSGTFFGFQHKYSYTNPGLHVKQFGSIGLPLSSRDASSIAAICNQSPFGKGEETIVDTSIRKTWELDCTEFDCQNPAWQTQVDSFVKHSTEVLGVGLHTRAERYKLLLYEPGGFFKPHKDSEKVPGMFGTLVICLPSEHVGGDVYLTHRGETQVLTTATTSKYDLTALSWYSDVSHEIKPLVSGYRLVLIYNLVQSDTREPVQTAAALTKQHALLQQHLRTWQSNSSFPDVFLFPLEHKYSEANLSQSGLKGSDASKGKYLGQVCNKNGVLWFIGTLTRTRYLEGNDLYEEMSDIDETDQIDLPLTVTPSGGTIQLSLDVRKKHILPNDFYEGRDPDKVEEEYHGNEGEDVTHHYRDTVLILMRQRHLFSSETIPDADCKALQWLFDFTRDDPSTSMKSKATAFSNILNTTIAKLAPDCGERKPWRGAVLNESGSDFSDLATQMIQFCRTSGQSNLVFDVLQRVIRKGGWTNSDHLLHIVAAQVTQDISEGIAHAWESWFPQNPNSPSFQQVHDMHRVLPCIRQRLPLDLIPTFEDFEKQRLGYLWSRNPTFSKSDVNTLIALMPHISPPTYFEFVVPALSHTKRDALSAFMKALACKAHDDAWKPSIKATYEKLIQMAAPTLRATVADFTLNHYLLKALYSGSLRSSNIAVTYLDDLLEIFDTVVGFNLVDEVVRMVNECFPSVQDVSSMQLTGWQHIFNFSKRMLEIIEKHDRSSLKSTIATYANTVFGNTMPVLLNTRPREPADWAREQARKCDERRPYMLSRTENDACDACQHLSRFLADPSRRSERFSYAMDKRKHIQYSLNSDDYDFRTDKTGSPHTLVVSKTKNQFFRCYADWQFACSAILKHVQAMQRPFINILLGNESLSSLERELTELLAVRPTEAPQRLQQLNNREGPLDPMTLPMVAGMKRKHV